DDSIQLLRFANRVPLQFDKSACAITQAVETVNWRAYGLQQSKDSLPMGPYVFAISVVSPFIKFKNASKETIDSSEELVEEIRRALMQAGQKLSRHIRKEHKEADLERKIAHIEQFGPILIQYLGKITDAKAPRMKKAEEGLRKLLGRDAQAAERELTDAEVRLQSLKERQEKAGLMFGRGDANDDPQDGEDGGAEIIEIEVTDDDATTRKKTTKLDAKGLAREKEIAEKGSVKGTQKAAGRGTQKSGKATEDAVVAKAATKGTQKSKAVRAGK
ncbi:MAG: hypothetical protein V4692_16425, partial [Bdellovibrionota bacterium]